MKYVYLIRSDKYPDKTYTGLTSDVQKRLASHNAGKSPHTSKYRPWTLVTYLGFSCIEKAIQFERYLKSGSGRAFALKRLW